MEVSPNCDIAGLRKAIKNELGEDSDFNIFCWGEQIEDETLKLKDFGLGFVDYQIQYPTASGVGQLIDFFHKPHKVQISSDKEREIICPRPGRTPTEFFAPEEIDDRTVKYQLTSAVSRYHIIIFIFLLCYVYGFICVLSMQLSKGHECCLQKYRVE